jgi:long-chain fatty acid transport protein
MKANRIRTPIIVMGAVAFGVFLPALCRAGGFQLNEGSVSGLGTAYAGGAASAKDVSTIFFNPAGIALLDHGEFQTAANGALPSANFSNQDSRLVAPGTPFNGEPLTGGNDGDPGVYHVLPNLYLSQPVFRSPQYGDLSVGIGFSVPWGLETDYSPGWVGRYQALRSKLSTYDIQPTVAYRYCDRLSIGASVDIQYASARLTQAIDLGGLALQQALTPFFAALPAQLAARGIPLPAIPGIVAATERAYLNNGFVPQGRDGVSELSGSDWDVGFMLGGILEYLKPGQNSFLQDGRIGVSYRSGITHNLQGSVEFRGVPALTAPGAPVQFPEPAAFQNVFFNQSATTRLELPEVYHFSIYQRFLQQFAVMGDVNWTRWSRLQTVPVTFSNPGTPGETVQLRYKDTQRYAIGLEWYATDCLTLRMGFAYDKTPISGPDFEDPRIPDNNRYWVTVGFQWKPTSCTAIDFGYAHLFVDSPTVNTTDAFGHNLRGTFDASVNIISASVTFLWGEPREAPPPTTQAKAYGGSASLR